VTERIRVAIDSHVAHVLLNRPEKKNALDGEILVGLREAALDLPKDPSLRADIRIVAPDARLAFSEVTWGLVPDMSGTQAMRRLIPLDLAKKIVFTGETISGEEAVAYHLATETSDRPLESAFALAEWIPERIPDAIRAGNKVVETIGIGSGC
jgi:enoyl-CoA hydratase/carnithine racemase